jgi:putative redox protein
MKAVISQVKGCCFVAQSDSGHKVSVDTPKEFFGSDSAASPMELLLISLGSCSGCDIVSILKKKKVDIKDFEIFLDGIRSKDHPRVFTTIDIEYVFYGENINEVHVKRAIELSMNNYCPVSAMLKPSVTINYSYKIIDKK